MKKFTYLDIAKTLIKDAKLSGRNTCFDFSNIDILAKQLEEILVIRWGKNSCYLKNVAEYVKKLT